MQNFLTQRRMQPQKIINTYKFRLKRVSNNLLSILAQQIQNFLRQGGMQPLKSYTSI